MIIPISSPVNLASSLPFDLLLPGWWRLAYLCLIAAAPLLLWVLLAVRRQGRKKVWQNWTAADATSVSRELARQAQPWIGRLAFLGFPVVRVLRPTDHPGPEESARWILANAKDRSTGYLTGTRPGSGGTPVFTLRLITFLNDGRVIVTADRRITRRAPAHWDLVQRRFDTLESQVREHQSRVATVAGGAVAILPQPLELPARLEAEDRAEFDALRSSGDYADCGPDALRPSLPSLPRLASQDFAALFTGSAIPSGRRKDVASATKDKLPGEEAIVPTGESTTLSPEQLVERDLLRYRQHADQPPAGKQLFLRLLVLGATLFIFTAVFGREDPVATVGMLLAIIAVHEFGHWLAMKVFGYRGMGRFFLPFIGPIERGRKLHASPWQQIIVILAGPVPGLMAGLALLTAGFFLPQIPPWLLDLGGLAVVLNAFHLLPFLPLDGGKIVDLLVFRDLPLLRPLFTSVSAVGTLLASFVVRSRALRIIAIGMFAGLIWDIRMIKVVRGGRRIGWAGSIDDENEALRRIFHGIRAEENDAFLRSTGWQRQIDVLLAEVLRKRPGFPTRILGGGLYWICCGLPILAVIGLFALMLLGGLGSIGRFEADSAEFREDFPQETRTITDVQFGAVDLLVASTQGFTNGTRPDPDPLATLAAEALPKIGSSLDKLDWAAAGIVHRADGIQPAVLSLWLEILCGKLESSTREGRLPEAIRRAESLLYGIGAMEPALTLAHRELLWEAELRTLAAVEKISATGRLDATTRARFEARLSALNKAPLPEVENLLLVGGWGALQMERLLGITGEKSEDGHAAPAAIDARFWRHAYPHLRRLSAMKFPLDGGTPATVALARHWKKSRRAGELPPTLGEPVTATPEEAEFILAFCENHRRIQWRRIAALSALRLEAYRVKTGSLPEHWRFAVPGGGTMSLVHQDGPLLDLTDHRGSMRDRRPAWLGSGGSPHAEIHHQCPLYRSP
jgi:Zn-dependent protease